MEKRKISEFVTFVPGINPTRARKKYGTDEINYYDQAAFDQDDSLKNGGIEDNSILEIKADNLAVQAGDVVISNALQLATIVGKINVGKIPSLNFTKVEFDNGALDKRYFVYLFNAYHDIKRQKERELQGNGKILRIPLKSLSQLEIPVVPIEKQIIIGKTYFKTLKLQAELNIYAKLVGELTAQVLGESLKE